PRRKCSKTRKSSTRTWSARCSRVETGTQGAPPVLELENVTSGYSEDIDIIRNLSLEVPKGEMRGIIGLNGAGKSTLLKTICSFLRPKRGDVRLNGKSLLSVPPHECLREGLFLIPQ